MRYQLLLVFFFTPMSLLAQNLIVNPGAETPVLSMGWTQVSGNWNSGTEVAPHGGTYHFYAGGNAPDGSELYQDIDVSAFAASIDAGLSTFTFSAWMRLYNFTGGNWNDPGKAIVEYRDASSSVLSTYDTGYRTNLSWTQYTDARVAPAGTRTIRIRLISRRLANSDADGYFDDLSLVHSSAAMPVSLLSFTATSTAAAIELNWQTTSEESNDFFTVEKSRDGVHWKTVSHQRGLSYAQQLTSYQAIDEKPLNGLQYYRIKQTDEDGSTTIYPMIAKAFTLEEAQVVLYPNPSAGLLTVYLSGVGQKTLRVLSLRGELLIPEVSMDTNEYTFDLTALAAGAYVVEVENAESVQRKQWLKY